MVDNDFSGLSPINFFQLNHECHSYTQNAFGKDKKKYMLPVVAELCNDDPFADIYMAWAAEGIHFNVTVNQEYLHATYPDITKGDSLEIFIDTRDVKTSGYNTRFCHHFFFLPEAMSGHQCGEITRFRTDESHPMCDPQQLKVKTRLKNNSYEMQIFISSECLYGYDPKQFDRIGFTYRVNRTNGPSQHFSATSDEYRIEQQPSLWSSIRLV
ncbi:MAG: sugar-binding protein [Chlamydiota bacterium]|nr:sugar-binding protein [Chlamydiota bacterium]